MSRRLRARVDRFVESEMIRRRIPGLSLAISHEGQPLMQRGYGYADLEHRVAATPQTVYEIASVTKLFTAEAVMLLVEQAKLDLDAPLAAYLSDLPLPWQPITLRQALSHQSGIKSYTAMPEYWRTARLDLSRQAILGLVADLPLQFTPGDQVAYDNTAYYLLGLLLEAVEGRPYGDLLQALIFQPLGMIATRVNVPAVIVPRRAAGYTCDEDTICNALYYSPSGTFAAGVLLSTVADMVLWDGALARNRLLSPASRRQMWQPQPSRSGNEREHGYQMGLGWFLFDHDTGPYVGHTGNIVGFASAYLYFPRTELAVTLFCNQDAVGSPHEIGLGAAELALAYLHGNRRA